MPDNSNTQPQDRALCRQQQPHLPCWSEMACLLTKQGKASTTWNHASRDVRKAAVEVARQAPGCSVVWVYELAAIAVPPGIICTASCRSRACPTVEGPCCKWVQSCLHAVFGYQCMTDGLSPTLHSCTQSTTGHAVQLAQPGKALNKPGGAHLTGSRAFLHQGQPPGAARRGGRRGYRRQG